MLIIWKLPKSIAGRTKCTGGPYVARGLRVWEPWFTVWNLLNYTRLENAHKVRKKASVFYYVNVKCATNWWYRTDTGLCEPLWSIRLNCQLMTKLEMMRILQAHVCGCISAHPGLPDQKTKRETSNASKSQRNQASWNRAVLKFGSENQLHVHNYLSILFLLFFLPRTIWKRSRNYQVVGCAPHA